MINSKAQIGVKEMIMTLVIAGVIAVIGVLIFSNVTNVSKDIFPKDRAVKNNESVTITSSSTGGNSTLLAESGYVENTETVKNNSAPYVTLNRNVDYKIVMTGTSGDLTNRANFTLLNVTNTSIGSYNGTELVVTYEHNKKSAAQTTSDKVDSTTLDSFELGVIALIVLAATVVLGTIYYVGR